MKKPIKKNLKNVVFLLVMLHMSILFGQHQSTKKRIVIDVGHGGQDPGAIGLHDLQEKALVLAITEHMRILNNTLLKKRLDLYLTRYHDTLISLADRSRLAKALEADVFISLHCNAAQTPGKGMEVYIHKTKGTHTQTSTHLAVSLLQESSKKLGFTIRGVKVSNFQVLRDLKDYCPAVLIELGFVTHKDEADYFLKPSNLQALALAILMGIVHYIESLENTSLTRNDRMRMRNK